MRFGDSDAPFIIERAEFLGTIAGPWTAQAEVLAQDGAGSFAVPGGSVWLFGDTFLGTRNASGEPVYNGGRSCTAALLASDATDFPPQLHYVVGEDGRASNPFSLFDDEPEERFRIWPGGAIAVGGRYYVFYDRVEITGPGPWGFLPSGAGLARGLEPLGPFERLRHGRDWQYPLMPHQIIEEGGLLYLFAAAEWHGARGVLLARVAAESIEDPSAYIYYTGPGPRFSTNRDDAQLLIDEVYGQVSIAWNDYLGAYLMACSSDFFHPHAVRFRVADALCGPWRAPVAEVIVPETQGPTDLVYCAYLHPEWSQDGGRGIAISYCPMLKHGFAMPEMVRLTLRRTSPRVAD